MTTLEKLTEELTETEKTAALDPEILPWQTRGAWAMAIGEAKTRLETLRAQYKALLMRNAVAIFVDGDSAKTAEFAKLVDEENGIVVDANALYDRLTKEVELTLGDQRSWGIHQTHKLHLALQEVMHELKLTSLPMPSRGELPLVPTSADTLKHIRNVVNGATSGELNALYVLNDIAKRALEIRYIGVVAPVLIVGAQADEQSVLARSFGKGDAKLTINSDDEVNKEYLVKALKRIRKK